MRRWKMFALSLTCVCCIGMLTGCGNRNNTVQTEKNNTTGENAANDIRDEKLTEEAVTEDGLMNETTAEDLMQDENDSSVNDVTDKPGSDASGDLGDAGADIIDGVGEAGKDLIDGVENAGDELTGNEMQTERQQ